MSSFFRAYFAPALFRIYRNGDANDRYAINSLERYGSNIIFCLNLACGLTPYIIPPYLMYQALFRRTEFFQPSTLTNTARYAIGLGTVYFLAYTMRAFGRATNKEYCKFLQIRKQALLQPTAANRAELYKYDAEFSAYPVDFSMKNSKASGRGSVSNDLSAGAEYSFFSFHRLCGWLLTNILGIKLIYPGSIALLQAGISQPLEEGRAKLITEKKGQRRKLLTVDGNEIDSIFFDRRAGPDPNGKILVISCEGNAGFYEIGFLITPLEAGYSVLGWNQPGFAGSSGSPFPSQVTNAMDAVVQFAIQDLNFKPEEIVLHGWSIGGFPVAWAAKHYPDVKAVVLDATFDHILPLATSRMPQSLEWLVEAAIKLYMNLDVLGLMKYYQGPLRFLRRSYDEVITTNSGDRRTNRGNDFLIGILSHRFPELVGREEKNLLRNFLGSEASGQKTYLTVYDVNEDEMSKIVTDYFKNNFQSYPTDLGKDLHDDLKMKLTLYIATRYLSELDATHCSPMSPSEFILPWNPLQSKI